MSALRPETDARDRVAVAGQVLRRGVEDEVRAVLERPQQGRTEERVVGDDEQPVAVAERRERVEVGDAQARVRRGLEEQRPASPA